MPHDDRADWSQGRKVSGSQVGWRWNLITHHHRVQLTVDRAHPRYEEDDKRKEINGANWVYRYKCKAPAMTRRRLIACRIASTLVPQLRKRPSPRHHLRDS